MIPKNPKNMPLADHSPIKRSGLKITNAASSVSTPKVDETAAFDEKAKNAFERDKGYKQRGQELILKFKSMVEDNTLPENKSILTKEIENEVQAKLQILAGDINNDEAQPESFGSIVLATLLMKMVLVQRDTMNVMAYKIERLEKQVYKPTEDK